MSTVALQASLTDLPILPKTVTPIQLPPSNTEEYITNARWLIGGIFIGKECCRKKYGPCLESCFLMWRLWIAILTTILFISAVTNLGITFWKFLPIEAHPDFFLAQKMKRMLILGPNLFPTVYCFVNMASILIALWIFTLLSIPTIGKPIVLLLYKFVQDIVLTVTLFLLILELVFGWWDWPDELYATSLEKTMTTDLHSQNSEEASVSKDWTDTQQLFECCGVNSYQDWFNVPNNLPQNHTHYKNLRILPYSCCKGNAEIEFCYEALSTVPWNEDGCLMPQIQELKDDWWFLTISTLFLYFSFVTLARNIWLVFMIKFPVKPVSMKTEYLAASHSSSWEKHPPPPRRSYKHQTVKDNSNTRAGSESEPLLRISSSAPNNTQLDRRSIREELEYPLMEEGSGQQPKGSSSDNISATLLYKSPLSHNLFKSSQDDVYQLDSGRRTDLINGTKSMGRLGMEELVPPIITKDHSTNLSAHYLCNSPKSQHSSYDERSINYPVVQSPQDSQTQLYSPSIWLPSSPVSTTLQNQNNQDKGQIVGNWLPPTKSDTNTTILEKLMPRRPMISSNQDIVGTNIFHTILPNHSSIPFLLQEPIKMEQQKLPFPL